MFRAIEGNRPCSARSDLRDTQASADRWAEAKQRAREYKKEMTPRQKDEEQSVLAGFLAQHAWGNYTNATQEGRREAVSLLRGER
jgi:hypothetical protein